MEETKMILSKLKNLYPAHFEGMPNERKRILLNSWQKELAPYSAEKVDSAINDLVIESKYMPKLSDIVRHVRSGGRAWMAEYSKTIAKLSHESVSRYARLHGCTWKQAQKEMMMVVKN